MKNKPFFEKLCLLLGIILLISAMVIFILWEWSSRNSQQRSEEYVQALDSLLPDPISAFPESRRDNTMPVLALDGVDFVGILEIPRHGSSLPVSANWGQVYKYPCQFDGSVYNGSMQIGGTSQKGQYDFYRDISVGDSIFFTDMEGNRFAYAVTDIHYEKHADQTALQREEAALTLFIKNIYGFEYIVIFCNT